MGDCLTPGSKIAAINHTSADAVRGAMFAPRGSHGSIPLPEPWLLTVHASRLTKAAEELSQIGNQQVGRLHCREVAAAVEL